MKNKTEKEILTDAAKRLNVLLEEFTKEDEITISGFYNLTVKFDNDGNVVEFDTHP